MNMDWITIPMEQCTAVEELVAGEPSARGAGLATEMP